MGVIDKGENISVYAEKAENAIGIDFLEEAVKNARLYYQNVSYIVAAAEHCDFPKYFRQG